MIVHAIFDSTDIGHKELDLKMTDRVNMNMAGVPEGSFDHWAAKLIAKGYIPVCYVII